MEALVKGDILMGDFSKEAYEGHREKYPECYSKDPLKWWQKLLIRLKQFYARP